MPLLATEVNEAQLAVQYVPAVFSSTATTMLLVPSQVNGASSVISIHSPATGLTVPLNTCSSAAKGTQLVVVAKSFCAVLPMYTVQLFQLPMVPPEVYLKRIEVMNGSPV